MLREEEADDVGRVASEAVERIRQLWVECSNDSVLASGVDQPLQDNTALRLENENLKEI